MPVVEASNLSKVFRVAQRESGLGAALRSVLRRRYTDVRAVDGVSFNIEAGEIVGFLGPNGAGKTTTIRMMMGLLTPTSGRVRLGGYDLAADCYHEATTSLSTATMRLRPS